MKYEATTSFVGEICMMKGEVVELKSSIAKPLADCGYLKPIRKGGNNASKQDNTRRNSKSS